MSGEEIDLIVHGKELSVHIEYLILHSPYFERTLSCLVKDPTLSCIRLTHETHDLSAISYVTMETIVSYFYTGELNVTEENIMDILEAATLLELCLILDPCLEFLSKDLKASNVIKRFVNMDQFLVNFEVNEDSPLRQRADPLLIGFIVLNFSHLAKLSQLYELTTYEQFCRILDSPDLNIGSETEVYDAILKWVNYYPYDRYYYLPILLRNQLQWHCLRAAEFETIANSLPHENILYECYDYETITDELLPRIRAYHNWSLEEQVLYWKSKSKKPSRWPQLIVGTSYVEKALEYFDFRSKTWKTLVNRPYLEYGAELCYYQESLFLIGGVQSKSVYKYDVESSSWDESFPQLLNFRVAHGVIAHGDKIYVMGGSAKASQNFGPGLNEMEVYDPNSCEWRRAESMTDGRSFLGVAILKNKIYCTAGCLSEGQSSSEVYSLENENDEESWRPIESTMNKRDSCGLVATHNRIFAIGGYDNNNDTYLKTVEAYDPSDGTWTPMKSMNYARRSPGVVFYRGKIWVIGGMGEKQDLKSIEVYNPINNTWKMVDTKPKELSGWMRCCLIDVPLYMMKGLEGNI